MFPWLISGCRVRVVRMSIGRENLEMPSAGLQHEDETEAAKGGETYDVERERKQKENALFYLTESGRAQNREEAERYLEKAIAIKEKFIGLLRERIQTPNYSPYGHDFEKLQIHYGTWDSVAERNKAAMENITVRNLDRMNPELWRLQRVIEPDYFHYLPEEARYLGSNGVGQEDALLVSFKEGGDAQFLPDLPQRGKNALAELRKYLNEDELEFLKRDYAFALKDLQRELRAAADRVMETAGWETFAPQQEEE